MFPNLEFDLRLGLAGVVGFIIGLIVAWLICFKDDTESYRKGKLDGYEEGFDDGKASMLKDSDNANRG